MAEMIITETDEKIENLLGKPYHTILFNDNHHDMQEVSIQIIKAINCTAQTAANIMLEAHNKGRAIVITAHKEKCEHVATILEEIRLGTKVEPA